MNKYNDLPREYKNLVLLELIINTPHSMCNLANAESVKKAREKLAQRMETIREHEKFLKDSARLMGINPENPEEYIAQVILEERLNISHNHSCDLPQEKYAAAH